MALLLMNWLIYASFIILFYLRYHTIENCSQNIFAIGFFVILYLKFKLSNQKTLFVPRDNVIFHCISLNPRVLRVPWNIFCISWQHGCVPRVAMKYKIYSMARVGSTNFKITKMAGYAKEIDVVDELDEEIQRVLK